MTDYELYKNLKQSLNIKFKDYNLGELLGSHLAKFVFEKRKSPPVYLSLLLFLRVEKYVTPKHIKPNQVLFSNRYNIKRKDYVEFVDQCMEKVTHKLSFTPLLYKKNWVFKPKMAVQSFLESNKALNNTEKYSSFANKMYWAAMLFQAKIKVIDLENQLKGSLPKKFVAHNSSIRDDSFYTSVYKKLGVPTYTLQHGFYALYDSYIPVDIINYENFIADYMLCWGESSKENMIQFGIEPKRLLIAGNPKFKSLPEVVYPKFNNCMVLLGRKVYHNANIHLFKTLNKIVESDTSVIFHIKAHPGVAALKPEYEQYLNKNIIWLDLKYTISEYLNSGSFDSCISNNTSSYFDVLSSGYICLRYSACENEFFESLNDRFDSVQSFFEKRNDFKLLTTNQLEELIKESLKQHYVENSQERYKEILN